MTLTPITVNPKRAAGFTLLAVALLGTGLASMIPACTWQTRDAITGQWRESTPAEMTGFIDATGELAKTAVISTPLGAYLPLIDAAIRLAALFAAWRIVPTPTKLPKEA